MISTSLAANQQILPLTAQTNARGHLTIGGCDVVELVAQFGSPLYILDEFTFRTACRQYQETLQRAYGGESLVLYASKAWNCLATCALAHSEGLGIDVASGGELYTALSAGVPASHIYFHGNNKSPQELLYALEVNCTIVADNWLELERLAAYVEEHDLSTPPRVMLRLTPGIECHTHEYIRTGHLDSKFGFDPQQFPELLQFAKAHPELDWVGLHAHIGSQIFEEQPHLDLCDVLVDWLAQARAAMLPMRELNVGGGLGIRYVESDNPPAIAHWIKAISHQLSQACQQRHLPLPKLICEPGRSIVGPAAVTAYTVGSRKVIPELRTYIAVDGGMSDNPRPMTYQAQYTALCANRMTTAATETVRVAGKHCESGDILLAHATLPPLQANDILVVASTGAYNYSMASNYNRVPRPAAVIVCDGEANLILQRETYADLVAHDVLPLRLSTPTP
ncbi:diaminopimelate decarboxylase [Thermosynechococcus vestitus]|uniref:Diaminopimelate decarboxylase n=1 Tax=Thermosynechococcus vestitus (strain NIES-2133 / IAM M-273 / BP-1) TaxID=197221 RepID=Q8DI31_THEVB|nr:diaminopimelate decarboxylase [Thermosynechococcus vestitus]BAC09313.1 diaminopimelate decarboxylase [Thermosynechococcus vestitus BP-1]